jgi:subtilisin family serine protease/fibronectin type 3 domain-containing protein
MRNRLSKFMATLLALALLANASVAAAASGGQPAKGAPASTILGVKKMSKLQATNKAANNVAAAIAAGKVTPGGPTAAQRTANRLKRLGATNLPDAVPGELIIKYKPNTDIKAAAAVRQTVGATPVRKLKNGAELVKLPPGQTVAKAQADLKEKVEYAVPNHYVRAYSAPPDDDLFDTLWGLYNAGQEISSPGDPDYLPPGIPGLDIGAMQAWDKTTGSPDVVVAVVDTGIDLNHRDLWQNAWINTAEFCGDQVDNDQNGYIDDCIGWDFARDDNTVNDPDENFHGTHVAGTIAAAMNNYGVVGVAPNVQIMAVKFMVPDPEDPRFATGTIADAVDAITYAAAMGATIINNSWGTSEPNPALHDVIANHPEVLFVAAAGNDGVNMDLEDPVYGWRNYPAAFDLPNVLSVAAIDNSGQLASFSNYGEETVDVAAPGVSIMSTMPVPPVTTAAIANDAGLYKSMFWGFGIEHLVPVEAAEAMTDALAYLDAISTTPIHVLIDDESDRTGYDYPDTSAALADALAGFSQVTYERIPYDGNAPVLNPATHPLIIWATGSSYGDGHKDGRTLSNVDVANLKQYLNAGGKLLLAGEDAMWGNETNTLITQMLGATFLGEGDPRPYLAGVPGSIYQGDLYELDPTCCADYRDMLAVTQGHPTARPVLRWDNGGMADPTPYRLVSGTSMAAPHVAGIAALVRSVPGNELTLGGALRNHIMRTAMPLPTLEGKVASGGMAHAAAAVWITADDDVPGVPFPGWRLRHQDRASEVSDLDDVYRVYLRAGERLEVELTGLNDEGPADFDLYLFDPATDTVDNWEHILAGSEEFGSNEQFTFTAVVEGFYYIDVFAYQGAGSYELWADWGNGAGDYDDTVQQITYTTGWTKVTDAAAYNGGYASANAAGRRATFHFFGDTVTWYATVGPNMGLATVTLDGDSSTVDLWRATPAYNVPVFTADRLDWTHEHTLTITAQGMRSPSGKKTATSVTIDHIAVMFDDVPPPAPMGLEVRNGTGQVELRWHKDIATQDLAVYEIMRSDDGGAFHNVATFSPNPDPALLFETWTDHDVQNEAEYRYYVAAADWNGNKSATPYQTARPSQAPGALAVQVRGLDGQLQLVWPTLAESDIVYYQIERQDPESGEYVPLVRMNHDPVAAELAYPDPGLINGQTYSYTLYAVDLSGIHGPSVTVQGTPLQTPPQVPNVSAWTQRNDNAGTQLEWEPAYGTTVAYRVERHNGDGTTTVIPIVNPAEPLKTVDASADIHQPKRYTVRALNANGLAGPPTEVVPWPADAITVTPGDGKLDLAWPAQPNAMSYAVWHVTGMYYVPADATSFTLTGLTNGAQTCFMVSAYSQSGSNGLAGAVIRACGTPELGIVPPATVEAVGGDRTVTLNWTSVTGVDGYNVYRGATQLTAVALDATTTSYVDTGLTNETNYCYTVTSVKNGQESAHSTQACGTPADNEEPTAPTNLYVYSEVGGVTLRWTASTAPDVDEYVVYRYVDDPAAWVPVGTSNMLFFVDELAPMDGTTYTYYVTAKDDDGNESPYSNEVPARPHDGQPPVGPVASAAAGNGTVTLTWELSPSIDVDGYQVYRSTSEMDPGDLVTTTALSKTTTSFTDTGLANGQTYWYSVVAVDFSGIKGYSNRMSATPTGGTQPPVDTEKPSAPTNVQASASDKAVNLTWAASTDNVGVTGYTVYWGTGSTEPTTWNEITVTGTSWQQSMLLNGTTYWYKVVARDAAGNSSVESAKTWAMPNAAVATEARVYENTDTTAIAYLGAWTVYSSTAQSGGSSHYSSAAGASAEVIFTGSSVAWTGYANKSSGIAEVYIDGVKVATVDLYASTTLFKQTLFSIDTLASGAHSLKIVVTRTKRPESTSANVNIDTIVVGP